MLDRMVYTRNSPRYPLIVAAEVTELSSGVTLNGRSSDVSRTGCYIDTLNPVPAGSQIRVRLSHEQGVFETQARVVYISPGLGMGVAFVDPAANQIALLDRWLADAAKNQ